MEGSNGPVRGRASHRRRIALLGVLAAARGRPVARERLIGLLWPEHPSEGARRLLSESIYVLRKAMGEAAIEGVGDEVALNPQLVESDVESIHTAVETGDLEGAVTLYRGPLLDGFYLAKAEEFERWLDGERSGLAQLYAQALERLAEGEEERRNFLKAALWWRKLNATDPYSSRIVLRLMRALEAEGEHAAALRVAAEYVEAIRNDLGAEPDSAVLAYAERLRTTPPSSKVPPLPDPLEEPPSDRRPPTGNQARKDTVGEQPGQTADDPVPGRRFQLRRWGLAGVGLLLTVIVVVRITIAHGEDGRRAAAAQRPDSLSVAVLYFEDGSPDSRLGYIASDLTSRIIDNLAQAPSLRVISINGVKPYRDASISPDSIARALRVGTLVSGTVQGSADRLRVVVRLLDPATGRQLDSRTVEHPMDELLALEDEVVRQAADFLRQRLGRDIQVRAQTGGTRSVAARELFVRGQERLDQARGLMLQPNPLGSDGVRAILASADSLFAAAAGRDRDWLEPVIFRGWTALAQSDLVPARERDAPYAAALAFANAALSTSSSDAGALELRGTARWRRVQVGQSRAGAADSAEWKAAERDLRAALAREPNRARAWATLSQLLRVQAGRLADAEIAARRALEEDEFVEEAPIIMERLYRSSVQLARYDSAAAWCARGHRRFPADWRFVECRLTLLGYPGPEPASVDLAWRLYRELEQLDPPDAARAAGRDYTPVFRKMAVARVAARAGQADTARTLSLAARAEVRGDSMLESAQAGDEAYVRLLLGERDSTIVLLGRMLAVQPRLRRQVAENVKYRSLYSDPRFRRLVAETPEAKP